MDSLSKKRFIKFGRIGSSKSREEMIQIIEDSLAGKQITSVLDSKANSILNQVMNDEKVISFLAEYPLLKEEFTQQILHYVNSTEKQLQETAAYEKEENLYQKFKTQSLKEFEQLNWAKNKYIAFLEKTYSSEELKLSFYKNHFDKILEGAKPLNLDTLEEKEIQIKQEKKLLKRKHDGLEVLKKKIGKDWLSLITIKKTKAELLQIDSLRKKFLDTLFLQMEQFKKITALLAPFSDNLGRLWDLSKGNWSHTTFDVLKHYNTLLKNESGIKELADLLGRMRQSEVELEEEEFTNFSIKEHYEINHAGKSELVGVTESDDLNNLLPTEIALFSSSETESIFFKRFSEKKLQTYSFQSQIKRQQLEGFKDVRNKEKKLDKGPFIICVDTSGSMHGTPEHVAKVLAFAILKMAMKDNRKVFLISFSTRIKTLELTDLQNSIDALVSFLQLSFHGGTDATPAFKEAIGQMENEDYKKADLLMITDGVMPQINADTLQKVNELKQLENKFYALIIGRSSNNKAMEVFDENWVYDAHNQHSFKDIIRRLKELKHD